MVIIHNCQLVHTLITQTEYGHIILHTLITQTSDGLYYITYTYNTNRISDGHILLHTIINTNRISDGHIILHTLITQTEYLMVILYYIHL